MTMRYCWVLFLFVAVALAGFAKCAGAYDWDGDGRDDYLVFDTAASVMSAWPSAGGSAGYAFWDAAGTPVAGDFDGDGKADFGLWIPAGGRWLIRSSADGSLLDLQCGWGDTRPVAADYDGDGVADLAVFYPALGTWYIRDSGSGGIGQVQWGWSDVTPVPADYDGDGKDDVAIFHSGSGMWYVRRSSDLALMQAQWGWAATMPTPADYDGDGAADIAVYWPASGTWFIRRSSDGGLSSVQWGWGAALPAPGHYLGADRDNIAVYHPDGGLWYVRAHDGGGVTVDWGGPDKAAVVDVCDTASGASLSASIDALVAPTLTANGPGVAVLVTKDDQMLYARGHGLADIATRRPIDEGTVFDLASVAKQVTGMAVMLLAQQGRLTYTDSVKSHVPDFVDHYGDRPVTVLDLLHHVSGIADYTSDDWEGSDEQFANLTLEGHLQWLNGRRAHRRPGREFEYNNSGYALLALVVQRVAGQSFVSFMQEAVFGPLGMTNSLIYSYLGQVVPYQATGYIVQGGRVRLSSEPTVIAGDGNVFTSIRDMALYDAALRQHTLISAEVLSQAFVPGRYDNGTLIDDGGEGYGFGWGINRRGYTHHSGGWAGTSTYYRHYTNSSLSIIVLANDENCDTEKLGADIAALVAP
ncbi:MAG: hypothetical protein EOM20_08145 [Spartobacteria bacterium]|nr:hypothetical protein [Spartobacteria bacterium]